MADAADHAWTIAVATGSTPLPPHSPPLRHSGGGLNVAARHILLALYLHHRDLHLPDAQLPAPQAAALTPEAWVKVLPWVVVGAGGLGAGKTSGAGTRGVFLDVVIGGRTGDTDTNGGESSDNRSKVHADCGPAENPSL